MSFKNSEIFLCFPNNLYIIVLTYIIFWDSTGRQWEQTLYLPGDVDGGDGDGGDDDGDGGDGYGVDGDGGGETQLTVICQTSGGGGEGCAQVGGRQGGGQHEVPGGKLPGGDAALCHCHDEIW